jgi:phosphatidylethanolamine/phosphatidyl-N-methylethanolamine N-methyltransferase
MKMIESETRKTYDVWSKVYDNTFGVLVHRRQIRALHQLKLKPGDRVLDIGVGTGMTLMHYPKDVTVVGMDLSGGMLAKAQEKCAELDLKHCRLVRADAMMPPFAPQSFDHIMISHTISVVSDPNKLIRWAEKLVKPRGRIVLLNHFQSTNAVVAWFERVLNPMFVKLGWRSDLALEEVVQGVDLHVEYRFKLRMIDLWQIVVLTHQKPGAASDAPPVIPETQIVGTRRWAIDAQ